ncbi:MAG: hypothetical protein WDN27_00940 [Candidatus Saccharibacteria bacterium]
MRKRTRILLWAAGILCVIVVLFLALFIYGYEAGFGAPAHSGFTGYKPTVLPNGIQVTGQTLTRFHQDGLDIWSFTYQPRLSSSVVTISETSKDNAVPDTASCQGLGGICNAYTSPKGTPYVIWYSEYKGQPFDLQVIWAVGATHITLMADGTQAVNYIKYDWAATVDSMQAVNLNHVPVVKRNESGSGG